MRLYQRSRIAMGRSIPPAFPESFPLFGVSGTHTALRMSDGSPRLTGNNINSQLGLGNSYTTTAFLKPGGISSPVKGFVLSGSSTFLLTEAGSLYISGTITGAARGSLGPSSSSTFVLLMTGVKKISNFEDSTFVLKDDGTLWAAGANAYNQLSGSYTQSTFIQVASGVADMAMGLYHSLMLKTDGTVWVVGGSGSSGIGQYSSASSIWRQVTLPVGSVPVSVQANYYSSVVLMEDGTAYGSGNTTYGELGFGHTSRVTTFAQILSSYSEKIKKFSLGRLHAAALFENGDLYTCGDNGGGKLGSGDTTARSTFTKIQSGVSDVGCTGSNTLVVKDDHTLWGCGPKAQLGIGVSYGNQLVLTPITLS